MYSEIVRLNQSDETEKQRERKKLCSTNNINVCFISLMLIFEIFKNYYYYYYFLRMS